MWYQKLLKYLAEIICKTDSEKAGQFIEDLFSLIKRDQLEPEIIFGFINDLYNFACRNLYRDVSLQTMTRYSIGLIILHFKKSRECKFSTRAFVDLLQHSRILEAANLHSARIKIRVEYMSGQRVHDRIVPIPKLPTTEQYEQNRIYLPEIASIDLLNQLEAHTFNELNCTVRADLFESVFVLNDLLNKVEPQKEIILDLLDFIDPYRHEHCEFDELIAELEHALNAFPAPNPFLQPIDDELIAQRKINLKIQQPVHTSELEKEYYVLPVPLSDATMDIIEYLEEYKPLRSWHKLCFFCCGPVRQHTKEVATIIEQIKNKELFTTTNIIERLDQIKIKKYDDLEQIIKNIKKKYAAMCPRIYEL